MKKLVVMAGLALLTAAAIGQDVKEEPQDKTQTTTTGGKRVTTDKDVIEKEYETPEGKKVEMKSVKETKVKDKDEEIEKKETNKKVKTTVTPKKQKADLKKDHENKERSYIKYKKESTKESDKENPDQE